MKKKVEAAKNKTLETIDNFNHGRRQSSLRSRIIGSSISPTGGHIESILSQKDGRFEVNGNTNQYPWSIHGHMTMTYEYPKFREVYVGSGIMINHSHVLTAGHNLYSSKNGGIPNNVHFYPGCHGKYKPWSLKGKKFKIHPLYYDSENYDYDLALLTLEEEKVGLQTGWARLAIFDDNRLLEGLNINITGYPLDKFKDDEPYMYTMNGFVKVVHKNRFYYDVHTSGGQSGSGVYVLDPESENITDCFGIHTTGSIVEGNGATRINQEKFDIVGKWVTSS